MPRPRKLLSIAHSYVVRMNRRLAHELQRAGGGAWDVTAVAPKYFHGGNDLRPVRLVVTDPELCPVVPMNAYLTGRVHMFAYGSKLRSVLAAGWDMVHCWEEPYILAGGQVAWWTRPGTPLVYRSAQNMNKTYLPPFRWVERYAMRRAAGWICSGSLVAQNLSRRPGYDVRPMSQIPLGVDVEAFRPDPAAGRAVRQKLGWDTGPPVVGYLGRFVPDKGVELLTRVLDQMTAPWRALFVGAGPSEPALRAWAARHGDRVRICTDVHHDQVPAYLNAMDILCAPSQTTPNWKEQFGRMVIEAFAAGVPVVGSDSGEIPLLVNQTGVVVGEADEPGWTRALTDLIADPVRRRDLSARGVDRARAEFAWPVVARQHLKFFDSLPPGTRR